MKIKNESFIQQKVFTALGDLYFNKQGIADVKDENLYKGLLELKGFSSVEEEPKKTDAKVETKPDTESALTPSKSKTSTKK